MVHPSDLSLPNIMNEYLKHLDFNYHSLFNCKLNEIFAVQSFNPSFGSKIEVLFQLVYPSKITAITFCSILLGCPPVNDLIFT